MKALKVILFVLPWVWAVFLIPQTNRVEPFVLGMPFIMFWQLAGIVVTSLCLGGLFLIDGNRGESNGEGGVRR